MLLEQPTPGCVKLKVGLMEDFLTFLHKYTQSKSTSFELLAQEDLNIFNLEQGIQDYEARKRFPPDKHGFSMW